MGFGDEIITTALVKKAYAQTKKPICIGDGNTMYWSEIFENNPKIAREPHGGYQWINSYPRNRPYINYKYRIKGHYIFRDSFRVEPGELYLTRDEFNLYSQYAGSVYIEPNVKESIVSDKAWYFDRWQEIVNSIRIKWVQGPGRKLDNVEQVNTPSFRHACALLKHCKFFVGTDGGLHHAAAALSKPAVVVWGGFIDPDVLGYKTHLNLCKAKYFCGTRKQCKHCRKALNAITVKDVIKAINKIRMT
jgi:hypothetical protein